LGNSTAGRVVQMFLRERMKLIWVRTRVRHYHGKDSQATHQARDRDEHETMDEAEKFAKNGGDTKTPAMKQWPMRWW
jgi:hypothetical protein